MAPDYIYELAVLEVSRWQRQAWEGKVKLRAIVDWSLSFRDTKALLAKDTNFCPKVTGPLGGKLRLYDEIYADGTLPPHFLVPARIIEWDFWPAEES